MGRGAHDGPHELEGPAVRFGDVGESRAVRTHAKAVRPKDNDELMAAVMEEAVKAARLSGHAADPMGGHDPGPGSSSRHRAVPDETEGEEEVGPKKFHVSECSVLIPPGAIFVGRCANRSSGVLGALAQGEGGITARAVAVLPVNRCGAPSDPGEQARW